MSDLDPNESTTTTDLDPTTAVPTPTSPVDPDAGRAGAAHAAGLG